MRSRKIAPDRWRWSVQSKPGVPGGWGLGIVQENEDVGGRARERGEQVEMASTDQTGLVT